MVAVAPTTEHHNRRNRNGAHWWRDRATRSVEGIVRSRVANGRGVDPGDPWSAGDDGLGRSGGRAVPLDVVGRVRGLAAQAARGARRCGRRGVAAPDGVAPGRQLTQGAWVNRGRSGTSPVPCGGATRRLDGGGGSDLPYVLRHRDTLESRASA